MAWRVDQRTGWHGGLRWAGRGAAWTLRVIGALAADVADALWPDKCWVCGQMALPSEALAACDVHSLAESSAAVGCRRCAGPLAEGIAPGSLCSDCRLHPPSFRRAVCAFDYGTAATRDWILALKHGGRTDLAAPLVRAAWTAVLQQEPSLGAGDSLLVPVPLHRSRLIERGHDQAARLAQEFAGLGAGRFSPVLRRARATWSQGDPLAPGRHQNVRGAFRGLPGLKIPHGSTAWIVDDVLTTGATASACAQALKRMGAGEVNVLAVARA